MTLTAPPPPSSSPSSRSSSSSSPTGDGASRPTRPTATRPGPATLTPAELGVLGSAFVAGLVLRWQVVTGPLGYVDLDEATAGIAAREFFGHPMVFFPGQPYGGTPETVLVGLVHLVVGSGPVALKIVPALLHLLACVLVWDTARRVVPSRSGQLAAPVLLWLGPAVGVWESTKERGFYGAAIVVAAALIWLTARIDLRTTRRDVIAFGVCVGLGWWISPLLMLVAVPATVWLLVREPERLGLGVVAAPAALLGALPWIGWNVLNGFASLRQPPSLGTDLITRFGDGLAKVAVLTGLETPWDPSRTLVPGARIVAVVLVGVAVVGAFLRHPSTGASLSGALVLGYLLMYPLANNTGTVGADPRYLYPMLPALALVTACLLPDPASGRGAFRAGVVLVLVTALTSWGLAGLDEARSGDQRFLEAAGTTEVIDLLEERGVTFATTDLAGAQITYATEGRIKASSFAVPRFPELERLTRVRQPSTYVLDARLYGNAERLERWLFFEGIPFERVRQGVWVVILVDRWVPPWSPGLVTLLGPVERPSAGG